MGPMSHMGLIRLPHADHSFNFIITCKCQKNCQVVHRRYETFSQYNTVLGASPLLLMISNSYESQDLLEYPL